MKKVLLSLFLLLFLSDILAQSTIETTINTESTTTTTSQDNSQLRSLGKAVAQSSAFAVVTLIVTVLLLIREYFNNLFEIAESYPRLIGACYLLGGWFFAILCALLALVVAPNDGVTVTRMSLLFASASLAFGPFFVFSPVKPIKLKKQTFLKTLATVARKKSTRHVTFAIFCALTALQGIVAYDLFALLTSIDLAFEQVALTVFGYVLLTLFYLIVFYTTLLGRVFKVNDLDVVDHIRKHAFVEFRRKLHVLSGRHYAKFYVVLFLIAVALELATVGVAIQDSVANGYFENLTTVQRVLFGIFSAALILFIVVSCIFVLVAAFRPVPLTLPSGDNKQLAQAIEEFKREDRDVLALHLAPPFGDHHSTFVAFTARLSAPIRHRIESVAQSLLSRNTREPASKPIEDIGVAHLRPLEDSRRAVLTVSDDVEDNLVDEWLGVFLDRDGAANDDDAVRRVDLFVTLASAFAAPSSWAAIIAKGDDKDSADEKEKVESFLEKEVNASERSQRSRSDGSDKPGGDVRSHRRAAHGRRSGGRGGSSKKSSSSNRDEARHDIERIGKPVAAASASSVDDDSGRRRAKKSMSSSLPARDVDKSDASSASEEADEEDEAKGAAADDDEENGASEADESGKGRGGASELETSLKKPSARDDAEEEMPAASSKDERKARRSSNSAAAPVELSDMSSLKKASTLSVPTNAAGDGARGGGGGGGSAPTTTASAQSSPPRSHASPSPIAAKKTPTLSAHGPSAHGPSRSREGPSPPPPAMGAAPPASPSPPGSGAALPAAKGSAPPARLSNLTESKAKSRDNSAKEKSKKESSADEEERGPMPPPPMMASSSLSTTSSAGPPRKAAEMMPPPPMSVATNSASASTAMISPRKAEPIASPTTVLSRKKAVTRAEPMPPPPMFAAASSFSSGEEAAPPVVDELAEVFQGASETGRIVDIDLDAVLANALELPADFDVAGVGSSSGLATRLTIGDSPALVTRLDCDAATANASSPTDVDNQNLLRLRGVVTRDGVPLAVWYAADSPPTTVASTLASQINVADIGRLMLHLLRALMHLHASGRVHGAISPAAVLVVVPADGGSTRAVLCDWLGGDTRQPADATFLAPERRGGGTPRTVAADVYALGALLQWCTNEQTAGSATVKRRSVMSVLAERMTAASPNMRPSLDAVLDDVRSWKA
jgi:hypothetical protein